jgi:hypothetical protein
MELLRLSKSFHLRTDEFTPLQDEDLPDHATIQPPPPPGSEEAILDVGELEASAGDGESL